MQGAAIATVLSYFIVFVIRCLNATKYIPFNLQISRVIANTLVITLQAVVMVLEIKGWIIIQALCVLALGSLNYKFLIGFVNKILGSVFRRKKC